MSEINLILLLLLLFNNTFFRQSLQFLIYFQMNGIKYCLLDITFSIAFVLCFLF